MSEPNGTPQGEVVASPGGPGSEPSRPPEATGEGRTPLLRAEGVTKSFELGGRQINVLRGIDLELYAGEMVAVVGASGVGKSTLLHVLGTLDAPTQGRIFFEGTDLTRMSASRLADFRNRSLGFVFQFHHLLPEFSALENVMMPALIQRVGTEEARRRARELLEEVGLAERLHHRPGQLSGGEQQRVALARALVMSPKLLLADEPTGNLDAITGTEIHRLFYRMNRERGVTMVIVTHNPELAKALPRRLKMLDGRIEPEKPEAPYRQQVVPPLDGASSPDAGTTEGPPEAAPSPDQRS